MSTSYPWLQRLDEATDYRQLKSLFSDLAAEAAHVSDGQQLVASIDEAVRRIEHERARDANELQDFESQYAAFMQEQRGVLGWFRRHVPFSETRRQDAQHRNAIADQRAEILADNLIIARAQMLKQKLLPPAQRQFGEVASQWKSRLTEHDSIEHIGDYACTLEAMSAEINLSQSFVDEIRSAIDAFADAEFSSKEDRRAQADDVAEARAELAEFEAELEDELSIQTAAIERAGRLVSEDLLSSDPEYASLSRQFEQLNATKSVAKKAAEQVKDLAGLVEAFHRLADESRHCDEECEHLRSEQNRLERELESAHQRLARTKRKLADASAPMEEARRVADRADAAFLAAKRIYDQQQASEEHASALDVLKAEYDRLTQEREQAMSQLQLATDPYDSVKSKHEKRLQECEDLEKEVEATRQAIAKNRNSRERLAVDAPRAAEPIPRAMADVASLLNELLTGMQAVPCESQIERLGRVLQWRSLIEDPLTKSNEYMNGISETTKDQLAELATAIEEDVRALKQLASHVRDARDRRWSQHCHQLLGFSVAELVTKA